MRIIATAPEENDLLADLTEYCKIKGIYPSVTKYEYGFGITVWSVNDLLAAPASCNWPYEERLRFMEMYGDKIGGATEDSWAKLNAFVDEYAKNRGGSDG